MNSLCDRSCDLYGTKNTCDVEIALGKRDKEAACRIKNGTIAEDNLFDLLTVSQSM
ncbi:hypothetical protein ACFLUA_04240 [Chloroflexota bacterium]